MARALVRLVQLESWTSKMSPIMQKPSNSSMASRA